MSLQSADAAVASVPIVTAAPAVAPPELSIARYFYHCSNNESSWLFGPPPSSDLSLYLLDPCGIVARCCVPTGAEGAALFAEPSIELVPGNVCHIDSDAAIRQVTSVKPSRRLTEAERLVRDINDGVRDERYWQRWDENSSAVHRLSDLEAMQEQWGIPRAGDELRLQAAARKQRDGVVSQIDLSNNPASLKFIPEFFKRPPVHLRMPRRGTELRHKLEMLPVEVLNAIRVVLTDDHEAVPSREP